MVAVSSDPLLLNWEKVTGQAVIPIASPDGSPLPYRVFDPCIWQKDGVYYSLSGGTCPTSPRASGRRANFLLPLAGSGQLGISASLCRGRPLHPGRRRRRLSLLLAHRRPPHPALLQPHERRPVLCWATMTQERDKFVVTAHADFNFGAVRPGGVHAPSATPDGKGGVIVIFNMNPAKPTEGWDQIMTLPRRLTLDRPGRVGGSSRPAISSRCAATISGSTQMTLPANQEIVLDEHPGQCHGDRRRDRHRRRAHGRDECAALARARRSSRVSPSTGSAATGTGNATRAGTASSCAALPTAWSPSTPPIRHVLPDVLSRAPETGPVFLEPDEPLKLRVFIDRSVVEVFVNGKQCLALRVYPGREDSIGVSLRSQGKEQCAQIAGRMADEAIYTPADPMVSGIPSPCCANWTPRWSKGILPPCRRWCMIKLLPGQGDMDLVLYLSTLREIGFEGGPAPDLYKYGYEKVAAESVRFLHDLLAAS